MKHAPRLAALLTVAALALTACGADSADSSARSTIPASQPFNDADVAFATDMIPHHAQALSMVDLTYKRDLDPAFEKLAGRILDAQGPEIEQMAGWLKDWDQPVPETGRDHSHADSGEEMDMGGSMPGMMTADEMQQLEDAPDADFETLWLQMMIQHHEGAITMAETEFADGEYADSVALARSIAQGQAAEVEEMKAMLAEQ